MSRAPNTTPRILHIFPSFAAGDAQRRTVRLINAFGQTAHHAIVAGDGQRGAAASIEPMVAWARFPSLTGKPWPWRLNSMGAAMAGFDLVCTYGWGAIDATLAHTLFADVYRLAPLVHHEDGFDEDEAERLRAGRNLYRRIALGRTSALVVSSHRLERIALETWEQPRTRVRRIATGIDTRASARKPKRDFLPGLVKHKGESWLGTFSALHPSQNLPALVRAFAPLPDEWQLVIAGEGPERGAILAEAERLGVEHRVHLPGAVVDPARLVALFDVFAPSARGEPFPVSVVEAMAAGIPVASPAVGDVSAMVAEPNLPFIVPPGNKAALADALERLARDPAERRRIGSANQVRARQEFDERPMIERYKALYWGLMGRALA